MGVQENRGGRTRGLIKGYQSPLPPPTPRPYLSVHNSPLSVSPLPTPFSLPSPIHYLCLKYFTSRLRSISNIDDGEYHCNKTQVRKVISGVIGAASSVTSIQVANLLRLFKIPQVNGTLPAKFQIFIPLDEAERYPHYCSKITTPPWRRVWKVTGSDAEQGNEGG
ncbi:unnamed protein product [Nezara viridula]|uniref:Uncharacterized protein n=1 Tax=Nezara viridula TaxID=85310 RepID=A0A9P0HM04_NEZVI|nr:unnamed protein product [Nezara viridula]